MNASYPRARRQGLRTEMLADELLVYDLARKKAHCLNATAACVYESADGTRSVEDLARELAERCGTPADENLVWFCLDELARQELLEKGPAAMPRPVPTRRDLLNRLGIAAAVLPVVLSVALPRPASAQVSSPGPTGATGLGG